MKIAMWSGPRNLSTAMMYAFAQRADMSVWDEPFYAAYLARSGIDHPMREKILARHEQDPEKVARMLEGPVPDGCAHWYQKHMPFHVLDGFPLEWARDATHVHLIRHPARVIASYVAKRENPVFEDLGFAQQEAFFERFPGPVIDSTDIRDDPEAMLRSLCDAIELEFDPAMLSWHAGCKPYDGIWASHWYGAVHRSTGFAGPEARVPTLAGPAGDLVRRAMPYYERLRARKLRAKARRYD